MHSGHVWLKRYMEDIIGTRRYMEDKIELERYMKDTFGTSVTWRT